MDRIDRTDLALLDRFQRDLPLEPRPFARIAVKLGLSEFEVIDRLAAMQAAGRIARVGGTVRRGFAAMNEALKDRAEASWRAERPIPTSDGR